MFKGINPVLSIFIVFSVQQRFHVAHFDSWKYLNTSEIPLLDDMDITSGLNRLEVHFQKFYDDDLEKSLLIQKQIFASSKDAALTHLVCRWFQNDIEHAFADSSFYTPCNLNSTEVATIIQEIGAELYSQLLVDSNSRAAAVSRKNKARLASHEKASSLRKVRVLYQAVHWGNQLADRSDIGACTTSSNGAGISGVCLLTNASNTSDPGLRVLIRCLHYLCTQQLEHKLCLSCRIRVETLSERSAEVAEAIMNVLLERDTGLCCVKVSLLLALKCLYISVVLLLYLLTINVQQFQTSPFHEAVVQLDIEQGDSAADREVLQSSGAIVDPCEGLYTMTTVPSDEWTTNSSKDNHQYIYMHVRPDISDSSLRRVLQHLGPVADSPCRKATPPHLQAYVCELHNASATWRQQLSLAEQSFGPDAATMLCFWELGAPERCNMDAKKDSWMLQCRNRAALLPCVIL